MLLVSFPVFTFQCVSIETDAVSNCLLTRDLTEDNNRGEEVIHFLTPTNLVLRPRVIS